MLALTRKTHESIVIDGKIEIKILDIQGDKVKLGISAPKDVSIHRQEIYEQIKSANYEAGTVSGMDITEINKLIK